MVRMNSLLLRKSASGKFCRTTSRSFPAWMAATVALLLASGTAPGRETKLGSIGFELPKDWKVQMDGTERRLRPLPGRLMPRRS